MYIHVNDVSMVLWYYHIYCQEGYYITCIKVNIEVLNKTWQLKTFSQSLDEKKNTILLFQECSVSFWESVNCTLYTVYSGNLIVNSSNKNL